MARRGQANRDSILVAAYEAIATLGWPAATTAEICRRAGVSSGTFFHYFPTKEDLLPELLAAQDDQPAGLDELVDEIVREARDPLAPAFVLEVAALARLPRVREALRAQEAARTAGLRAALDAEHRDGRLQSGENVGVLAHRAELVIAGFETMAASPDADITALEGTFREMLELAIGWVGDAERT